jgi:hypothetical protein
MRSTGRTLFNIQSCCLPELVPFDVKMTGIFNTKLVPSIPNGVPGQRMNVLVMFYEGMVTVGQQVASQYWSGRSLVRMPSPMPVLT